MLQALTFWQPAIYHDSDFYYKEKYIIKKETLIPRVTFVVGTCLGGTLALLSQSSPLTSLAFIAATVLPPSYFMFEIRRATHAIKEKAIEYFKRYNVKSDSNESIYALPCISTDPESIRTLLNSGNETAKDNMPTLFPYILKTDVDYNDPRALEAFKLLIDAQIPFTDYIDLIISHPNPAFVTYFLEKVKPCNLSPVEQTKCWLRVKDYEVADLLLKNKFDINIVSNGSTPLIKVINAFRLEHIGLLLSFGASVPDNYKEIISSVKSNNENETKRLALIEITLEKAKDKDPLILNDLPSFLPDQHTSIFNLSEPAIEIRKRSGTFKVATDKILYRTALILLTGTTIMAVTTPIWLSFAAVVVAIPLGLAYINKEISRAMAKLNDLALEEFRKPFPTLPGVLKHMLLNPINLDRNLTKFDASGNTLWGLLNIYGRIGTDWKVRVGSKNLFPAFQQLADRIFEGLDFDDNKKKYFNIALHGLSEHVAYLFDAGLVKREDFTPEEQKKCYTLVRSHSHQPEKMIALLQAKNFQKPDQF